METYIVIHFRKNNSFYDTWTISMVLRKRDSANINFVFPMVTKNNWTFINFNGANVGRYYKRKKFLLDQIYTKTK
ncbi:hypothetical protein C174_12012 [Bacillus mycoides FSL H7-687]|nr:hypothetical protein C174_12012 [Bacillus mycoides FSL H7-687]